MAIGDAIATIPNPMEQATIAVALFGKSGADLLPAFKGNLAETAAEAERLGLVLSDDAIAAGDRLGDALDTLGLAGTVLVGRTLVPLVDIFTSLYGAISATTQATNEYSEANKKIPVDEESLGTMKKIALGVYGGWSLANSALQEYLTLQSATLAAAAEIARLMPTAGGQAVGAMLDKGAQKALEEAANAQTRAQASLEAGIKAGLKAIEDINSAAAGHKKTMAGLSGEYGSAAKAAADFASKVKGYQESAFGVKAMEDADVKIAAVGKSFSGFAKMTGKELDAFRAAMDDAAHAATLWGDETKAAGYNTAKAASYVHSYVYPIVAALPPVLQKATLTSRQLGVSFTELAPIAKDMGQELRDLASDVDAYRASMKFDAFGQAALRVSGELTGSYRDLAQAAGTALGSIGAALRHDETIVGTWRRTQSADLEVAGAAWGDLSARVAAAASTAVQAIGGFNTHATAGSNALYGLNAGMTIGSQIAPGYGTAIGGIVGAMAGLVATTEGAGEVTTQMLNDWIEQMGGIDDLTEKLKRYGLSWDEVAQLILTRGPVIEQIVQNSLRSYDSVLGAATSSGQGFSKMVDGWSQPLTKASDDLDDLQKKLSEASTALAEANARGGRRRHDRGRPESRRQIDQTGRGPQSPDADDGGGRRRQLRAPGRRGPTLPLFDAGLRSHAQRGLRRHGRRARHHGQAAGRLRLRGR